jgi:Ser/Thr protein kinase RdoA (MazF antagonist)
LYVDFHDRAVFGAVLDEVNVVIKADTDVERHERELATLRVAAAAGVPVPRVVMAAATDPGIRLLALERVDGPTLRERSDVAAGWRAAGASLARLHLITAPAQGSWRGFLLWSLDHERSSAQRLGLDLPNLDAIHAELLATFADLPEPEPVLIHGDAQPEHVVLGTDAAVAAWLDFGDAMVGDAAWDIAVLVLDDPDRLDEVLDGYEPSEPLRARIAETLRPYRVLRYLGEANWLTDHGFDPSASLAGLASLT